MSYGLICKNASGDIMFDSTKQMNSYVVSTYGTASSVPYTSDSLVFVKGTASVASDIIYGEYNFGNQTYDFKAYDASTDTVTSASLPYIHVTKSVDVTPASGDNYGLRVFNPDGTVQFDSRSIKSDSHFSITDYHLRLTLTGNAGAGPNLVTSTSEYVEIKRWSSFTSLGSTGNYAISGVQFFSGNTPKHWAYTKLSGTTSYNDNLNAILIAELI